MLTAASQEDSAQKHLKPRRDVPNFLTRSVAGMSEAHLIVL
jgi:hypothetical protein